jgi:hypothetical protein
MVDSSETLNPTWTFNVGKRPRPTNQRTKTKKKPTKKSIFIIANSNNRYLETTGAGKQSITILFIGKGKELFGSWVQTYFFGRCGSHRTEWG